MKLVALINEEYAVVPNELIQHFLDIGAEVVDTVPDFEEMNRWFAFMFVTAWGKTDKDFSIVKHPMIGMILEGMIYSGEVHNAYHFQPTIKS